MKEILDRAASKAVGDFDLFIDFEHAKDGVPVFIITGHGEPIDAIDRLTKDRDKVQQMVNDHRTSRAESEEPLCEHCGQRHKSIDEMIHDLLGVPQPGDTLAGLMALLTLSMKGAPKFIDGIFTKTEGARQPNAILVGGPDETTRNFAKAKQLYRAVIFAQNMDVAEALANSDLSSYDVIMPLQGDVTEWQPILTKLIEAGARYYGIFKP